MQFSLITDLIVTFSFSSMKLLIFSVGHVKMLSNWTDKKPHLRRNRSAKAVFCSVSRISALVQDQKEKSFFKRSITLKQEWATVSLLWPPLCTCQLQQQALILPTNIWHSSACRSQLTVWDWTLISSWRWNYHHRWTLNASLQTLIWTPRFLQVLKTDAARKHNKNATWE